LKAFLICSVVLLSSSVGILRADLVVNGGFEATQTPGFPIVTPTNAGTLLPGWTVTDSSAQTYTNVYLMGDNQQTYYQGDQSVLLNSDGLGLVSISQDVTVTANQRVTLTFALTSENAWTGDQGYSSSYGSGSTVSNPTNPNTSVAVTLGAQTLYSTPLTRNGWTVETLVFTPATTGSELFTIADNTSSSFPFESPLIDAVSLTPEPEFYGVLALGLAGLAVVVRRRKRA